MTMKGYTQIKGIDYNETFAPVINKTSIRLLLAIAAKDDLDIMQYDIKTAFLIPRVKEKLFATMPEGFLENLQEVLSFIENKREIEQIPNLKEWKHWLNRIKNNPKLKDHIIVELKSSVYGSKQGAHDFYEHLKEIIETKFGYKQSELDPCVYMNGTNKEASFLGIYTDDIIHLPRTKKEKDSFKKKLMKEFKITDKGDLKWFIGLRITRNRPKRQIYIDQESAITNLLRETDMLESNPKKTPMEEKISLVKKPINQKKADGHRYRSIIGSLIYFMTGSRPDICFAVSKLAQFMSDPYEEHQSALMRILRYLKGTKHYKLRIGGTTERKGLITYTDADWATDTDDRKSQLGYVIKYDDSAIAWRTKKQSTVALSTTEAELYALSAAVQESLWIKHFMNNLGFDIQKVKVYEDNNGVISIVKNNKKDGRTKHIEIKHNFLRDEIRKGKLELTYLKTELQLADSFTKPLGRIKFERFRKDMGIIDLTSEK